MQIFTNKFSVAMNQDKTEVVINFFQNVPRIPSGDGSPAPVMNMESDVIPVANLVMTGQCAQNFVETLSNMLNMSAEEQNP